MKPELKPCPFCGGIARRYDDGNVQSVYCIGCTAAVKQPSNLKLSVVDKWNRRSPAGPDQPCTHKWGVEFSTHNHEPARTVCVKCGYKPDTRALNAVCEPVEYWLCCGSTDPAHADRKQPDCYDPNKAKFGTVESHKDSAAEPVKVPNDDEKHR